MFENLELIDQSMKLFIVDLLLGGDNAILIALACRGVAPKYIPRVMFIGVCGAIIFRVIIASVIGTILAIPVLKIAGAVLLILISINLLSAEIARNPENRADQPLPSDSDTQGGPIFGAAMTIIAADAVMSLDNVVALAAIAQGNSLYLMLGIGLSVPILFLGSAFVNSAMTAFPLLLPAGTAMLGWIAGQLIVTDPLIEKWIISGAESVAVFVPPALAIFVVVESYITARHRAVADQVRHERVATIQVPAFTSALPLMVVKSTLPLPTAKIEPIAKMEQAVEEDISPPKQQAANDKLVLFGLLVIFSIVMGLLIYATIAGSGL